MNYKQFFRSLLDISMLGYFLNFRFENRMIKILKRFSFEPVTQFWEKELADESMNESGKVILTDSLVAHLAYNEKNYLTTNIVRKLYSPNVYKVYSLIPFSNSYSIKFLSKVFRICDFVVLYKFFNITVILRALFKTLNLLPGLKYDVNSGFEIHVDGQELGGLIYDEYLRKTDLHTVRHVNLNYYLFIFRSLYFYYRYKQIIKKYKISDVIIGHNVYAYWGFIIAAANAVNNEIKVWNWANLGNNLLNVVNYNVQIPIPKPKYFKREYIKNIDNYIKKNGFNFNIEVNLLKKNQFSGKILNKDTANVFYNNKITDFESFRNLYSYAPDLKTIVIYSHAFVDAVRYPRWSLFADYFTWLEQTLNFIKNEKLRANVYIKPHPSEKMYPCKMKTSTLVQNINIGSDVDFILLDKQVSNEVIFGFADLIITSSGSVAIEGPLFNVNVLVAGESDCENANAIIQPKTQQDYFNYIKDFEKIPKLPDNKREVAEYAFYWYNKLSYSKFILSVDAVDEPMDNIEIITPWVTTLNKAYESHLDTKLVNTKFYKDFSLSVKNGLQDLFYF